LIVLETDRLILRRLTAADAEFMFELVNDPSWLRYIGDRGVRNLDDARNYILDGPVAMYDRLGFGLYLVELRDTGAPIGICGVLKRDSLDDVDIGFAFLPRHWGNGYAFESAAAVKAYANEVLGLRRLVAITSPDNDASIRVLERIGFRFEKMIRGHGDAEELRWFAADLSSAKLKS
jgi:RimJ/RimL family protein N-acetyltransferase